MTRFNQFLGLFSRSAKPAPSPDEVSAASAMLYEETAVAQMVKHLTRLPDMDAVLKQAGIKRHNLRTLLFDDEIAQACETRLDALLAVPMRIEPSEGAPADLLRDILKPVIRDAISGAFSARLYGYSVMEAVYMPRADGKIGLKFLGEKPMQWFEPKPDGQLIYFPDDGSGGGEGIPIDQEFKFFLTRSRPSYANPFGEALISRLYWPWFFRQNGWKFWAKFLERFGSPLLVGKSSKPQEMVNALLMAHSQAVIGIGPTDTVEAVGAAAGNNGAAFESFEAAILRRIQKVVLGQTLTSGTDNGSGNRALGQVHDAVRMDKRTSDIDLIQGTVQRVIDALCALNKLPAHTVIFADGTGLEADRAVRDKDLFAVGVRFNRGYFEDAYDLNSADFELSSDISPSAPNQRSSIKPTTKAARFSLDGKANQAATVFTAEQQTLELHADSMLEQAPQPIDTATLRGIILAATSPEDLESRLIQAAADTLPHSQLAAIIEQAIFAADVVGYTEASKDITKTEHDVLRSA